MLKVTSQLIDDFIIREFGTAVTVGEEEKERAVVKNPISDERAETRGAEGGAVPRRIEVRPAAPTPPTLLRGQTLRLTGFPSQQEMGNAEVELRRERAFEYANQKVSFALKDQGMTEMGCNMGGWSTHMYITRILDADNQLRILDGERPHSMGGYQDIGRGEDVEWN